MYTNSVQIDNPFYLIEIVINSKKVTGLKKKHSLLKISMT